MILGFDFITQRSAAQFPMVRVVGAEPNPPPSPTEWFVSERYDEGWLSGESSPQCRSLNWYDLNQNLDICRTALYPPYYPKALPKTFLLQGVNTNRPRNKHKHCNLVGVNQVRIDKKCFQKLQSLTSCLRELVLNYLEVTPTPMSANNNVLI